MVSVSTGGAKVKMLRRLGTRPIGATPAERGDGVAPCTGGVHQHRRAIANAARVDLPATAIVARDRDDLGVADDRAALAADAAQEALVQTVHVDVGSVGLEHRAEDMLLAQRRHELAGGSGVEQAATRAHRLHHLPERGELGVLTRGSDEERAARATIGPSANPAGGASRKERLARVSARTCAVP
mgnify:CR=1 FL=1